MTPKWLLALGLGHVAYHEPQIGQLQGYTVHRTSLAATTNLGPPLFQQP